MNSFETNDWSGGINNLAPANRTPEKFVRDAVNVDPTVGGELHLRTGYAQVLPLTAARGVLALNHKLLVAAGTDLIEYDTRTATQRVLRQIAGAGQFVGDVLDEVLYFFTANEALQYDGHAVRVWGVPDVLHQPVPVSAGDAQCKLAVTFTDEYGREGGTDAPLVFRGGDTVTVTLPQPPEGGKVNLYLSAPNGETLYHQQSLTAGGTVTVRSTASGRIFGNGLMQAPPVGTIVRVHNSQIAIGDGRVVWLTAPMRPHLVDRRRGWFQFAAKVGEIMSDGDLFVSSDKLFAINAAETDEPSQRVVLEFPAISGTAVKLPDGRFACMTRYGQAVTATDPRGTSFVELVNREKYVPPVADSGTAAVVDHNGNQIIITSTRGQRGANPLSASDFFVGEVIRP